jgi:hypothetical protein
MKRAAWALAFLMGTMLGCAGAQRVYFRPAGAAYEFGPPVPAARYRVPETGDRPLLVQAACLGVVATEEDGKATTRAEFEFRAKNKTGGDVTFPVAAFLLRDDEGREFGAPAILDLAEGAPRDAVTLADGERRSFALAFDVSGTIDPGRVGSLLVRWKARVGGTESDEETKFVRYEVRDVSWPPPAIAFASRGYRSPYWVGVVLPLPPYYYDPYFDDPWFWAY